MNISLLIIEDFIPALNKVGFISRFSQTFGFLSIIVYLLFIREFAHISQKAPKINKVIKIQILFTALFLVFELFVCFTDDLSYLVRKPDVNGLNACVLHHPWREKNGFLGGLQGNPHLIQLWVMAAKILVGPLIRAQ